MEIATGSYKIPLNKPCWKLHLNQSLRAISSFLYLELQFRLMKIAISATRRSLIQNIRPFAICLINKSTVRIIMAVIISTVARSIASD